jgi:hypothetical protein
VRWFFHNDSVLYSPGKLFAPLRGEPRFQAILRRLEAYET